MDRRQLNLLSWDGPNIICSGPKSAHDFAHMEVATHLFLSKIEALSDIPEKRLAANPIFTRKWYWKTLPVGMEASYIQGLQIKADQCPEGHANTKH